MNLLFYAILIFIGVFVIVFMARIAGCVFSAKIRQRVRKRWFLHTLWGVISILIIAAAFIFTFYADYSDRAKISNGVGVATEAKVKVALFYREQGRFPDSNAEAGLVTDFRSEWVESLLVGNSGTITILYSLTSDLAEDAAGKTIVITPHILAGNIEWDCTGGDMPSKHRPASCR